MVLCGPAYTLERMLDYIHSLERKKKNNDLVINHSNTPWLMEPM